jgi:hypothetical protein
MGKFLRHMARGKAQVDYHSRAADGVELNQALNDLRVRVIRVVAIQGALLNERARSGIA